MGFVKDIFSSKGGANFQAAGADPAQLDASWMNTQAGVAQQQDFVNALRSTGNMGIANQNTASQMLLGQANGVGPNPAQAQYMNNINQLAAQQAGAIASQKGLSPALQARLIAQQGGAAMQNAAGQAATLQAQQQLSAQNALADLGSNQITQNQNALNALSSSALGQQGNVMGLASSANAANSGLAQQKVNTQGQVLGGLINAAGKAAAGGAAMGGMVDPNGCSSSFGRHVNSYKGGGMIPGQAAVPGDDPRNDVVPAMLSPKEIVLPRSVTMSENAPEKAAAFVAALLAQKRLGKK